VPSPDPETEPWQVWIDRGGTFTDCLGREPRTGRVVVAKVLSGDDAPIRGIRALLELGPDETIPPCEIRMGTTIATNALLERKGVSTALLITRGFGDLLAIGDQSRPELFSVDIRKPSLLYDEVFEIDARLAADGSVLARPDPERLREALEDLIARGIESLAVVVLHAYRDGALEREIGALASEVGFERVTLSHEVAEEIGMLGRGDTTVVDAYLTPLIARYLQTIAEQLPGSTIRVMQSSGALTDASRFRGRDAILSGPAGGVVACAEIAHASDLPRVVGFDMGGTSTDVSRYAGEFDRAYETQVAGVRLRAPMMNIHTVAAGGGSLCRFDGHRFTVGPESAGAEPGPLCYGHPDARELALTDVSLALGRLDGDRFPFPLDRAPVDRALERISVRVRHQGDERDPLEVAEAFFRLAVDNMAEAIRQVSVARGHDVRDHALIVFGGAGGQFACALANQLEIRRLIFHPFAGVLSAWGMGVAEVGWHDEADAGRVLLRDLDLAATERTFDEMQARGRVVMHGEGVDDARIHVHRRLDLRYRGTETSLTVAFDAADRMREAFEHRHQREFGYTRPEHPIEAVTVRMEVLGHHEIAQPGGVGRADQPRDYPRRRMWTVDGMRDDVPVLDRDTLVPDQTIVGPALLLEGTGTIVVEPGWTATVDEHGVLTVSGDGSAGANRSMTTISDVDRVDPLLLEVFNNRFMSIAEQMGTVLRRTALSTNIRERLDFSCAVFDPGGGLVANAPHIPVHLGAMSESVKAVIAAHPTPHPGDVFVTNDPAAGGSHLPDITVVTPVHDTGGRLCFFTASRGHHADVGGITPGSMPPFSRSLDEEGVVFRAVRIVRDGQLDHEGVLAMLHAGPHPARHPEENLGDLEAQIAANRTGAQLLLGLADLEGMEHVLAYMRHVQQNAADRVEEAIAALPDGEHAFEDALDDGTPICVTLGVEGRRMGIDFSGTGTELDGNLNAPRAVTVAAVLYVLRTLVGHPIPLNSGCLAPIDLVIPARSVLNPSPGRAVAAGNVETSQRVVDVLLGAIGQVAASQGTMNNFTFGTDRWGYYETIGGGAGAGNGFDGASGVHTHMTNTRITDPEVLEARFPVRLIEFGLRGGSGGAGRWRGGDGLVRELEFLEPMRVSILSERRTRAPFGLAGGAPGAMGRNTHRQTAGGDTTPHDLGGKSVADVATGDRVRIETPGGGGFGAPPSEDTPRNVSPKLVSGTP
jgi:5-oxoprolinase (ATP-hydrolysing)